MHHIKLGNSDLLVSPLTVGCWSFGGDRDSYWGEQNQADVNQLVGTALNQGINFFDTAFGYNDGRSEQSLGEALAGRRHQAVICNKMPAQDRDQLVDFSNTIDASLQRLQTDYIDLMMIHWPPQDEALLKLNLQAMQNEQSKGKIRFIGVSNFAVKTLGISQELGVSVIANEFVYNLLSRGIEHQVLPYCRKNNIGITAYMPIMQGILTGKYRSLAEIPPIRKRTIHFNSQSSPLARHGGAGADSQVLTVLECLRSLSAESGYTVIELAIGWLMAKDGVSCIIAGCRSAAQLHENAAATQIKLKPDLIAALDQASQPLLDSLGDNLDIWQIGDNSRIW